MRQVSTKGEQAENGSRRLSGAAEGVEKKVKFVKR